VGGSVREVETTIDATVDATSDRRVLLVLAPSGLSVHPLPDTGVLDIGRAEECHVQLRDRRASRFHARLHPSLVVEDLGSANGTWLGDTRLEPNQRVTLAEGQALHVGDCMLIIRRAKGSDYPANRQSETRLQVFRQRIVRDPAMVELYAQVERLANGAIPILIVGETGVGKALIAEAIHLGSSRSRSPFIRVDCAMLGASALDSALFGHERGAFAGAVSASTGLIEAANGGTVFLDEVFELPLSVQAKLLRVLEAGEVTPVGGLCPRAVNVRFVAATNQNLHAQVEQGSFRADLLYRLSGASIAVPPLRERTLDILPLAAAFLRDVTSELALAGAPELAPDALDRLRSHSWPGNARELRNVIERALLVCDGSRITAGDLLLDNESAPPPMPQERERIQRALTEFGGNQSRAAEHLGIPRRTLVRRIAQLRLPRPRSQG